MAYCYLRYGVVFIPSTISRAGLHFSIDPVDVIDVDKTEALVRLLQAAFVRPERLASGLPSRWPSWMSENPILKHSSAGSWTAFLRTATGWSLEDKDGHFYITSWRCVREWKCIPDRTQDITLPEWAGLEESCRRLAESMQRAAAAIGARDRRVGRSHAAPALSSAS